MSLHRTNQIVYRSYHKLRLLGNRVHRKRYLAHMERMLTSKPKGLASVSELSLEPVFWEREIFRCNEIYAHDLVFKQFLGVDPARCLEVIVEHGCVFSEVLVENHLTFPGARQNIVMSRARSQFLARHGISSTPIGPYLHYAGSFFDEQEISRLKRELGKTLLYFPSHSTLDVCIKDSFSEIDGILSELKKNHGFDSVLICGYYMDIEKGLFQAIEKKDGYHFVTCGNRLGPFFQGLLKSFLLLADVVASNSAGTQAGYALYCGKPFWIVGGTNIWSHYKGDSAKVREELAITSQPILGTDLHLLELESLFRNQSMTPDEGLRSLVGRLWGFDDTRSPQELKRAIFHG